MQSTEIITPQSLLEFEGPEFEGIVRSTVLARLDDLV